jgi:hypothetical protein
MQQQHQNGFSNEQPAARRKSVLQNGISRLPQSASSPESVAAASLLLSASFPPDYIRQFATFVAGGTISVDEQIASKQKKEYIQLLKKRLNFFGDFLAVEPPPQHLCLKVRTPNNQYHMLPRALQVVLASFLSVFVPQV